MARIGVSKTLDGSSILPRPAASKKMQITVLCFAQLKEFFAVETKLELDLGMNIQNACQKLLQSLEKKELGPRAEALISNCKFSIEDEFVGPAFCLREGMVLCLLPPSSGG